MRRHACSLSLVAVLVLAACGAASPAARAGGGTQGQPRPQAPQGTSGAVVHVQGPLGITTFAPGGTEWDAPGGIATPDWGTIFRAGGGVLRTLDGVTGSVRAAQSMPPDLRPVVASADGRWVALADTPARIGQSVFPPGRTRSTILVAPASAASGAARAIHLDGNIVPEAFSSDAAQLFVIEFLPPAEPDRYRVRSLTIATGQVGPVYTFDKAIDTEIMQGLSRTQAFAPTGAYGPMLYTLYSRADGPTTGYGDLHALSLAGGLVHCTDFPASLQIGPEGGAIAAAPDGQRVYVANGAGTLAEVDASAPSSSPGPFAVARTAQLAPGSAARTVALAAGQHELWLALGATLYGLDAATLKVLTTMTLPEPVVALTVSGGGALYAASSTSVERIDPPSTIVPVTGIDSAPTRIAVV